MRRVVLAGRRSAAVGLAATIAAMVLGGCAALPNREPLRVNLVGLERLKGEGFELRFAVKLRVQNPNESAIEFDGISIDLDVNGRPLASGVSAEAGTVPRFGELVITVPVSVSASAAVRQMIGLIDGAPRGEMPYAVRGRFAGGGVVGLFGGARFSAEGSLKLPS
jgi:LEA14-like dessication related protein